MLVYIRENALDDVASPVTENDIPESLVNRLQEEKRLEMQKRKEKVEAHLYMNIHVLTHDHFHGHQGNDLFDVDKSNNYRLFKIKKSATLNDFLEMLSENLKYPVEHLRIWPLTYRSNQTFRPTMLEVEANKSIHDLADTDGPWYVFVETLSVESTARSLPPFDKESDVLLFLKRYDPKTKSISYCGHIYTPITATVGQLMPVLCERGGFPQGTDLIVFEEVKPNLTERIEDYDIPLEKIMDELMDGDILVFQKDDPELHHYELPTAKDYFKDLYYRIEVTFCDKTLPNDNGFTLELSQRMNYDQVANAVAQHLGTDPYLLQFFKAQGYREGPGNPIRCTYEGSLKDLFTYFKQKSPRKIYYQPLSIRISELENKRQFKCTWVNMKLKEEKELVLYPDKNGSVADLLTEARKQVELHPTEGSGKLRLMEIISYKIFNIQREDIQLECLSTAGTKSFRVEEIPLEEQNIDTEEELLIPCAHFQKEIFSTFGVPFMLRIRHGEAFSQVKERIQKRLEISEKEFEKWKFAIVVMGRQTYMPEDTESYVNIQDFQLHTMQSSGMQARPWLGLDHINKTPKRSRYTYLEKAIKIHN